MAAADHHDDKLHIAMFPWLAIGHMMPWVELVKLIAQKGHSVSFISSPRNIDRLPQIPTSLSPFLRFVKLPLPPVDGLPPSAEATTNLPPNQVQYLKKSLDLLQQPVTRILGSLRPDWIFYDFAQYWARPIAARLGIKSSFFSICIPAFLRFLGPPSVLIDGGDYRKKPEDFTVAPNWVDFPSTVAYTYYDIKNTFDCVEDDASGVNDLIRIGLSARNCDVVTVRSCSEFDSDWLRLLENIYEKPVLPVGQLPPPPPLRRGGQSRSGSTSRGADPWSTWHSGARRNRLRILGHGSVGGFLTHSGWSSVVEALSLRRALILLTFYSDQGINARVLEERELGYCIPRDESDGSFTRDSLAESLRVVMVSEEGKVYRDKAKEMSGLFGDRGRQSRYVDNVLAHLFNK
ncbi:unnamed protein product [Linum trigynum]|uniref:Uncharacterized protein n=1 Tax=Linum trigynum TaxID=586398 RepID=A0AAV2DVS9_9ROSI